MTSRLFGRVVRVTVGQPGAQGRVLGTQLDGSEGHDIEFRVQHTASKDPNAGKIVVYNPSDDSAAAFAEPGAVVKLVVGYEGSGLARQILQGTLTPGSISDTRQGVDRVLQLEVRDGGSRYDLARVSLSYATETSARQLFDAVAAALDLPLGEVDLSTALSFPRGYVGQGPARRILDDLCSSIDRIWTIRDGAIVVYKRGQATGEAAVVFSSETGNLIGSPSPLERSGVEIRALIAPALRPGSTFEVRASKVTGQYIATDVRFEGGTVGDLFDVVARGRPR